MRKEYLVSQKDVNEISKKRKKITEEDKNIFGRNITTKDLSFYDWLVVGSYDKAIAENTDKFLEKIKEEFNDKDLAKIKELFEEKKSSYQKQVEREKEPIQLYPPTEMNKNYSKEYIKEREKVITGLEGVIKALGNTKKK